MELCCISETADPGATSILPIEAGWIPHGTSDVRLREGEPRRLGSGLAMIHTSRVSVGSPTLEVGNHPDVQWYTLSPAVVGGGLHDLVVGSVYIPPRRPFRVQEGTRGLSFVASVQYLVDCIRELRRQGHPNICILGDWNCHIGSDTPGVRSVQAVSCVRGRYVHDNLLADRELGLCLVTGSE